MGPIQSLVKILFDNQDDLRRIRSKSEQLDSHPAITNQTLTQDGIECMNQYRRDLEIDGKSKEEIHLALKGYRVFNLYPLDLVIKEVKNLAIKEDRVLFIGNDHRGEYGHYIGFVPCDNEESCEAIFHMVDRTDEWSEHEYVFDFELADHQSFSVVRIVIGDEAKDYRYSIEEIKPIYGLNYEMGWVLAILRQKNIHCGWFQE